MTGSAIRSGLDMIGGLARCGAAVVAGSAGLGDVAVIEGGR